MPSAQTHRIRALMDYFLYLIGLLLLALPTGLLHGQKLKLATMREIYERRGPRRRLDFIHKTNLVDLVRGFAGLTFLQLALKQIDPSALGAIWVQGALGGVALLSLLVQHGFYATPRDELPVPVAFSLGLALALLPVKVAVLTLPVGIMAALAVQNIGLGLVLTSAMTAGIGKLLGVPLITLAAAIGTLAMSPLLGGLLGRPLALAIIKGREKRLASVREIPVRPARG